MGLIQNHHTDTYNVEFRQRVFGAVPPVNELVSKSRKLLKYLRPVKSPGAPLSEPHEKLEWNIHEIAHHYALAGSERISNRSLSASIESLSPAGSDGNEIDALALDLGVCYWLGIEVDEKSLFIDSAELMWLPMLRSARKVRQAVSEILPHGHIRRNSVLIAQRILGYDKK